MICRGESYARLSEKYISRGRLSKGMTKNQSRKECLNKSNDGKEMVERSD